MNATITIKATLDSIKALQADRARLVAELASMPKSKAGSQWHTDREYQRRAITRQISNLIQMATA